MIQGSKMAQNNTIKVLVADDDPPTRMLLRAAIAQWGYTVIEASNGEDAWEILQQPSPPSLLILDWLMPKLDGIELAKKIRSQPHFHPYIILLTQVAGTGNIIKSLEAGADEFLSKPFNMAELKSRLSVGARIIGYENTLTEQNQKLARYATDMEALVQERIKELFLAPELLKNTIDQLGGTVQIEPAQKEKIHVSIHLPMGTLTKR